MIPESGTRAELKAAWFESILRPVVGEVYAYTDGDWTRELWEVMEINRLGMVMIDVYVRLNEEYLRRSAVRSASKLSEWRLCVLSGDVRYYGAELPAPVAGVVMLMQ